MALKGHLVLIVEDDPFIGLDMRWLFEAAGSDVIGPIASANEALRVAREKKIELAVLDFEIIGGSTHEVARALAERGTPFLFHTGSADHVRHLWPGQPVFTKPADPQQLVCAASEML